MGNMSVDEMKEREKRCCCKHCGGPLTIKMIIYNKYGGAGAELYCSQCRKIEYGTEPEIYRSARDFVERFGFNHFQDLEENERTFQLNIAKVCEIQAWCTKYMGLTTKEGFVVPVNMRDEDE